jgi:hypothetical protein
MILCEASAPESALAAPAAAAVLAVLRLAWPDEDVAKSPITCTGASSCCCASSRWCGGVTGDVTPSHHTPTICHVSSTARVYSNNVLGHVDECCIASTPEQHTH